VLLDWATRGPLVGLIALGTPLLAGVILLVNAMGAWGQAAGAVYVTGLVLYLVVAGFAFGLIILSFLGRPEGRAG
jgi:uncharacterized membrane protein